jgi:hypothetical protein
VNGLQSRLSSRVLYLQHRETTGQISRPTERATSARHGLSAAGNDQRAYVNTANAVARTRRRTDPTRQYFLGE